MSIELMIYKYALSGCEEHGPGYGGVIVLKASFRPSLISAPQLSGASNAA
tara:strand:+ start:16821 stop:16970 length:150 start_codon:yes stop_codon:yes gene_type:complete